jgi:RNA polymerase sigma-70 factor (ECF subfamily)
MTETPDNRRLVEGTLNGDQDSFKAIYDLYGARIYNFLLRLLGSRSEAEDATQQTFLIVLGRIGTLRDPDLLESWIYRIARNEVYQKFRRKEVGSLDEDESRSVVEKREGGQLGGHPEKALLNEELGEALQASLDHLPLKLREVFILAVVDEMSYQDISAIVGRSLLSIKTDIYRARMMTKERLGRYLDANKNISVRRSGV